MATRKLLKHSIRTMMGQASGYNPEGLDPKKALVAYNFYLQNGMMKKIPGSSLYLHSSYGSSPIPWLAFFQSRAIWQLGQNLLIETSEGSQTETLLASDFDTDTIRSDVWQEKIYLANGKQLRFYESDNVFDLGVYPPGNGKVPRQMFEGSDVGPGSLSGEVRYTITVANSVTETESLPIGSLPDELGLFNTAEFDSDTNPLGWITLIFSGLTSRALSIVFDLTFRTWLKENVSPQVDIVRIYRAQDTGSGLSDYRLLAGYDFDAFVDYVGPDPLLPIEGVGAITSPGEYIDDGSGVQAQASLGAILLPEDKAPPPTRDSVVNAGAAETAVGPKFVRFWRDSLFLFGSNFPTYTVTDSFKGVSDKNFAVSDFLYGSDTSLPEYYPFNWEIGSGDGQEPTGIAVVGDVLCLFKERSIYTLVGTSLNNFVPKIQDEVRGCIASGSLQETPYGAMCLSAAGVIRFGGTGASEIISDDILDVIQSINKSALNVIASSYDPIQEIYTLYYPSGTATQNNMQAQFSIKDRGWTTGERARFIASAVTIPKTDAPYKSLVATAAGGYLLNISSRETVSDYEDQRITAYWRSAPFDFGEPGLNKRLSWLYVRARCAVNWIASVAVYCDEGQAYVFQLDDANSESVISRYASSQTDPDGAVYDESRYVGEQTETLLKIPINGIGREFFVEITEASMTEERHSFDLISVDIDAELLAR